MCILPFTGANRHKQGMPRRNRRDHRLAETAIVLQELNATGCWHTSGANIFRTSGQSFICHVCAVSILALLVPVFGPLFVRFLYHGMVITQSQWNKCMACIELWSFWLDTCRQVACDQVVCEEIVCGQAVCGQAVCGQKGGVPQILGHNSTRKLCTATVPDRNCCC